VLRVANRIGIAEGDDPVAVEQQLTERLPPSMWTLASDVQILHGRRVCRPTNPRHDECPVADDCDFHAAVQRESRAARPSTPRRKPRPKAGPKAGRKATAKAAKKKAPK
jgi:adenine-specific DNA glycosylase